MFLGILMFMILVLSVHSLASGWHNLGLRNNEYDLRRTDRYHYALERNKSLSSSGHGRYSVQRSGKLINYLLELSDTCTHAT